MTYYTSVNLTRNTQAKAEDINTRTQAIQAGFDKLPNPHAGAPTTKGFSETFVISPATGLTNPVTASQVQNNGVIYAADSGAADAYVITVAPVPAAYAAGQAFLMKASAANTGASTINVNALGVKSITTPAGAALSANDIRAGGVYQLVYDGTNFQLHTVTITTATVLDENDMASNSATSVPSQKSVKAYADAIKSLPDWEVKTTDFNTVKFTGYIVDAGLTITLPASPADYDQIWFSPGGDMVAVPAIFGRNGKTIMGLAEDMDWDATVPLSLIYTDGDWRLA